MAQVREVRVGNIKGPDEHRNDNGRLRGVALQRSGLLFSAFFTGSKVTANEEQVMSAFSSARSICSARFSKKIDVEVAPELDPTLPARRREVLLELEQALFVFRRMANENTEGLDGASVFLEIGLHAAQVRLWYSPSSTARMGG
ncbi:MAG TPA: hypothetical protein VFS43_16620 [Polyangiaceae bacterium]|nr:hypothetical protein [Polyangiaceae bacterium]